MSTPQPGIFAEGSTHHYFLEYTLREPSNKADIVTALRTCLDSTDGTAINLVVAFGPEAWRWLAADEAPEKLRAFSPIQGANAKSAPATQHDVLFWIHGTDISACFDTALTIDRFMASTANRVIDLPGFFYKDSRDFTGFIDGSANPKDDARYPVAQIPEDEIGAGGSYVLSQKWVHNLDAFESLGIEEQERVIGRTKPDSIEFDDDRMPPDSHVARTDFKKDGVAYKIYRRSVPYGRVHEHGLYFLAFACDLDRFDALLGRMFGTSEDSVQDRLLDFSAATTGSYWFAPTIEGLKRALED